MNPLLDVAEAQARVLALGTLLPLERVPLRDAVGRILAAPAIAGRHQPAADLSAMDGYAIRFADLPGPWDVIGESAAGRGCDLPVEAGQAVRIFTGAPLPAGADMVVIQENVAREGDRLRLTAAAPDGAGRNVRPAGADFRSGATLIEAGLPLTPARIALAAMGGHGALEVRQRPRVALLSTGDELVAPGEAAPPPLLPASNGPMLAALLAPLPVEIVDHGIVGDDVEALAAAFAAAAAQADIVVTTGGVSVGDHDLVRPALDRIGAAVDFWRVAMRPGKPLMAGSLDRAILLGLPGNPVSAFVTAHLFLLPLVRHLGGDPAPFPRPRALPLAAGVKANDSGRTDFLRARIGEAGVEPLASRDSSMLAELAAADALIVRAAGADAAAAGTAVEVLPLS